MNTQSFEDSYQSIRTIASNFKENESYYVSPKYQESEARKDFIDKFWDALGWDIYHRNNPNPYEREVRIEKNVIIEGRGKRADYAFYTSPNFAQARFMAEAKKPSRNLKNPQDCFQAVRYGWNSNTPLAVLTDFEEFLILDSRQKPSIETAANSVVKSYHYTDFTNEEKFSEIYFLFSREHVLQNSIEKYTETLGKFKGVRKAKLFNTSVIQPIDREFLKELDEQRLLLARAFKIRNENLDSETLTEITQRTLDRLVFLRFLEDKLVEADSIIDSLGNKTGSTWRDFIAEMPRLNKIYNGTLFKPHTLLDDPNFAPDEYSFSLIRDWLSHQNSAYDFNIIPIHILGSIYERFLGKTIETTATTATVVEKPEVRKAGGVYYTPEYIVRYIVENSVGKLVKGKTPEEIAEMNFADIACGSGSFLLGIFDYLIAYHVNYHSRTKKLREQSIKQGLCREMPDGTLQLTIHYKKEILLNNIYGVDLDAQAVEVAQFSLYLKLLEEETIATKQQFLAGYREQLLPSLDKNIVFGNSLIDEDIDVALFDFKDYKKLSPLNFQKAFAHIFQFGGFDAIVGNPPYGADFDLTTKQYLLSKYKYQNYQLDSYLLFLEKSFQNLIKPHGFWGMIIPNPWLTNIKQTSIRKFVVETTSIHEIVHFKFPVFPKVTVDTEIIILQNVTLNNFQSKVTVFNSVKDFQEKSDTVIKIFHEQDAWKKNAGDVINIFLAGKEKELLLKLKSVPTLLENYFEINVGIKPYQVGKGKPAQTKADVQSRPFDSEFQETEFHKKYLRGADINRYIVSPLKNRFIKYGQWLAEPRPAANFNAPEKLFMRQTGDSLIACYDNSQYLCLNNMHTLVLKDFHRNIKFFLGLINSKLLNWFHQSNNPEVGEALAEVKRIHVARLPMPYINLNNLNERTRHNKIVELVEKILEVKKTLDAAQTDKDRTFLARYCETLDNQIDDLVYDLYGLTEEEREVVEGK